MVVSSVNAPLRQAIAHNALLYAQDSNMLMSQVASLVHEAWFNWHTSLWQNRASHVLPVSGPVLLHGASRSRLAADVSSAAATPIMHHQAKALQLQLLVRHLARYTTALHVTARCCTCAGSHTCRFVHSCLQQVIVSWGSASFHARAEPSKLLNHARVKPLSS